MDAHVESSRGPSRRLRRIALSIGCIVLGVVGGLVVFALSGVRRPPPTMSRPDFDAAVARWQANRPADYQMTVEVGGRQTGTMNVVVDNHEPVSVLREGASVAEHTWEYWTVDGLFEIIRTDLAGLDQPERAFGAADVSHLVQQAEFDAKWGYPRRYRRAVLTTGDAIEWTITEFNVE